MIEIKIVEQDNSSNIFKGIKLESLAQLASLKRILASTSNNALLSTDHRLFVHNLDDLIIKKSLLRILTNRNPKATLPDNDVT